jgi:hypothetical protein
VKKIDLKEIEITSTEVDGMQAAIEAQKAGMPWIDRVIGRRAGENKGVGGRRES